MLCMFIDPFNVCKHRKPRLGARAAWGQKNDTANRPAYCVKEKHERTNGSAAELHEPMATIPANIPAETGGASGYISGRFAIGSSDFFSFSDDDFVYTDPEKPTRRWHASQ